MDCRDVLDGKLILKQDYSDEFDRLRKNAIIQSRYKYGPVKDNFSGNGNVDAIGTLKLCLEKFEQTHNTEYLVDVANYAMFRFMYPKEGEFFKRTASDESAGVDGITVKELERFRSYNLWA